jgi:hypothetical protein
MRGSWSSANNTKVASYHLVFNKREFSCPKSMCLHVYISKLLL